MKILLLALFILSNQAIAGVVACTGGAGNDYGGMTCTAAACDVTLNPSLGCTNVTPPVPGTREGPLKCYKQTAPYLYRWAILDDTNEWYPITTTGNTNMCAASPGGYNDPNLNIRVINDGTENLNCYELDTALVSKFCNNI